MSSLHSSASPPSAFAVRARRVGARTGMALAALMGGTLALLAHENPPLSLSIAGVTAVVIAAARPIGARVAPAASDRSVWATVGRSTLGGLACLLVAALAAGVLGGALGLWSAVEPRVLYDRYLVVPFLAVVLYGSPFATALGALHGLLVHGLLRRS
jgi:hypothetical protein